VGSSTSTTPPRRDRIRVSDPHGLLAAKAGASFLSPFVGRLDDINEDGMEVVRDLVAMVETYELGAEVLAASIRHPRHMTEAALAGSHIATVPFKILRQMVHHPLTDAGIVAFHRDWEAAQAAGQDGATAVGEGSGGYPG
jgi:transaldolase